MCLLPPGIFADITDEEIDRAKPFEGYSLLKRELWLPGGEGTREQHAFHIKMQAYEMVFAGYRWVGAAARPSDGNHRLRAAEYVRTKFGRTVDIPAVAG